MLYTPLKSLISIEFYGFLSEAGEFTLFGILTETDRSHAAYSFHFFVLISSVDFSVDTQVTRAA
jgi:hypothetical protein